jgi:hypothetical protein
MGKSETATASLGLKILLSDLVAQMNEENFKIVKKMLYDGCIEDSNGYFNEAYKNILGYGYDDNDLPETCQEFRDYVQDQFSKNGSYYKSKFDSKIEIDLTGGCLLDQVLLIPVKEIGETERWGYERYGSNSMSRPLDFDLSMDLNPFQGIEKLNQVFILKQHSG